MQVKEYNSALHSALRHYLALMCGSTRATAHCNPTRLLSQALQPMALTPMSLACAGLASRKPPAAPQQTQARAHDDDDHVGDNVDFAYDYTT